MKPKTERHEYPAATILRLIYHQRYGQNENIMANGAFIEITDNDILKLLGLRKFEDISIYGLREYLINHGLDIVRCGNSWLLGCKKAVHNISIMPPRLLELMSPGFVDSLIAAESVDATAGED